MDVVFITFRSEEKSENWEWKALTFPSKNCFQISTQDPKQNEIIHNPINHCQKAFVFSTRQK